MNWKALTSLPLSSSRRIRGLSSVTGRASACLFSKGPSNAAFEIQASNFTQESDFGMGPSSSETTAENSWGRTFHTLAENAGTSEFQHDEQRNSQHTSSESVDMPQEGHVRRVREGRYFAKFQLKNSSVLSLQRGDITEWRVDGKTDAIVNAGNSRMLGGGGVDGAIHRAAGPDLYKACLELPLVGKGIRCRTGDAVITEAFSLPVSKIIHTVGPVYENDKASGPLLESSYKSSLLLAAENGLIYIAFPALSCGIYGYPYDKAAKIALDTVYKHSTGLKEIHFVLFEEGSWVEWLENASKRFKRLQDEQ